MTKRMLIDGTHPEEIRVVVTEGNRLDEYDVETSTKRQLKGNIYLAKVTRVEPSLQAAFVDFGGNRHGFLAFNEIHPDYYQIPIADREALLAEHEEMERQAAAAQAHVDDIDGGLDDEDGEAGGETNGEADNGVEAASEEGEAEDTGESEPETAESAEIAAESSGDGEAEPETGGETAETIAESAGAPVTDVAAMTPSDEHAEAEVATDAPGEGEGEADAEAAGDDADAAQPIDPADAEQPDIGAMHAAEVGDAGEAETETESGGGERRRRRPAKRYKIQEVIKRRQILLVQVVKEERGNKGAALTTFISLAGRYCVLMPNTARGGGISRKITNATSRRKLRKILAELEIPGGMGVIMRTAGMERNKSEIKRDLDYLLRAWDEVRELTMQSTAPMLVYEEASLIKRAIRDLYDKDTEEILVDGSDAYQTAKKFMRLLMPSHAKRVQPYRNGGIPLFFRYQVEGQLDAMHSPVVQLKSGGYIVIHSTEALVAIDVNSGRATRARNIEETAHRTNMEAAEEIARQLRLRDLAGLIVIDFIDMDENRNTRAVERKMRESMKGDRARIQLGRISGFGLLELSRQRLRPSLIETSTDACPHCEGTGFLRSTESMAVRVLRAIEEEGIRNRSSEVSVHVATAVAIYILNQKRAALVDIERRYGFTVDIVADDEMMSSELKLERVRVKSATAQESQAISIDGIAEEAEAREAAAESEGTDESDEDGSDAAATQEATQEGAQEGTKRRSRRRRSRRKAAPETTAEAEAETAPDEQDEQADDDTVEAAEIAADEAATEPAEADGADDDENGEERTTKRRRRGRRGGRRRSRRTEATNGEATVEADAEATSDTPEAATDGAFDDSGAEAPVLGVSEVVEDVTETESAESPADDAPEAAADPVEDAPAIEAAEEPEPQTVDEAANDDSGDEAVAEAEPEAVTAEADAEPEAEPEEVAAEAEADAETPEAETTEAEVVDIGEAAGTTAVAGVAPEETVDRPRRKGWWQKLVE